MHLLLNIDWEKNKRPAIQSNWKQMITNGICIHSSSAHSYRWTPPPLCRSNVVLISKFELFWQPGNPIIVGPADGPLFSPVRVHQDQTSKIQEQIPAIKLSVVDARLLFYLLLPNCSCQVSFHHQLMYYSFFLLLTICSSLQHSLNKRTKS